MDHTQTEFLRLLPVADRHNLVVVALCRMDASLVNVFVSELVKFKTGGQCEAMSEAQKPQQRKTEDDDAIPQLTNDELTQLQDQMRKVMLVPFTALSVTVTQSRALHFLCGLWLNS